MTSKTNSENVPAWLTLLQGERHTRVRNALVTTAAAFGLYKQAKEWLTERVEREWYTVTVEDTDDVYDLMHIWILEQLPPEKRRSLLVYTHAVDVSESEDDYRTRRELGMLYDGSRMQTVKLGGHKLTVQMEDPQLVTDDKPSQRRLGKPGRLRVSCRTPEARDALLALIQELCDELQSRDRNVSRVYMATRWGSWERLGDVVPRSLETVVLTAGQREDLVADVERFLSLEAIYLKLGIPWHRGYVLHGPPGTGKTSIAQALAGHLKVNVYYIPLSDLNADTDLVNLLGRLQPRSVLLLEDIDVAHATRERDDVEKGVSLSGLLNALDGIITPHGLITVMTTNNLEVLDPALVRPGRADRTLSVTYADAEQLQRLLLALFDCDPGPLPDVTIEHQVTPAEVVEVIKRHLDDPDYPRLALAATHEFLERRVKEADPLGSAS